MGSVGAPAGVDGGRLSNQRGYRIHADVQHIPGVGTDGANLNHRRPDTQHDLSSHRCFARTGNIRHHVQHARVSRRYGNTGHHNARRSGADPATVCRRSNAGLHRLGHRGGRLVGEDDIPGRAHRSVSWCRFGCRSDDSLCDSRLHGLSAAFAIDDCHVAYPEAYSDRDKPLYRGRIAPSLAA